MDLTKDIEEIAKEKGSIRDIVSIKINGTKIKKLVILIPVVAKILYCGVNLISKD